MIKNINININKTKSILFGLITLLFINITFGSNNLNGDIKIIKDFDNVQTKNIDYNITTVKENFYHNNISITSIINKYIKSYNQEELKEYITIEFNNKHIVLKTKPIVSLLNGFLKIESGLDNFGGRIIANDFFNLTSVDLNNFITTNLFNYNINLLDKIKEIQRQEFFNSVLSKKNISYCNIGKAIPNGSNIIYIRNGKDLSLSIERKYDKERNKIGHKIAICKTINKYLMNKYYRKNLYYLLNAKTSYSGAILPFQFMPNNLYYYMSKYNDKDNIDLGNIIFYYKFISLYLFGNNYQKEVKKYNNHFNTPEKLKDCIKSVKYDPYCIYIKKQIFRYNHANWYVKRVMWKAYEYQQISDLSIFVSPVKDMSFIYRNIKYLIKNIKTVITQKYKGLKHWGIDISVIDDKIKGHYSSDKDEVSLIYNFLNPMECYFIPYNKRLSLSKDIGNVVFCFNKKYGVLYGHVKDLSEDINVIEKKYMPAQLVNNFVYQLVGKKTYRKGLNVKYYKIENIYPGKKIAYMGNSGMKSKGLHVHYTIINMQTKKFIVSNEIYHIIDTIKYYDK